MAAPRTPDWRRVRSVNLPLSGTDGACWTILAAAVTVSTALCLYLTRGLTLHADELLYFDGSDGARISHLLGPHNGHLILTVRLVYAACFHLFGAGDYLPLRIVQVVGVALVAGVFFALAKRHTGPSLAVGRSVLLLFLGGAWQDSLDPIGIAHTYAIATGLAALLVLEVRPRGADLAACLLLIVSIATFSSGLAFLVGVAVTVLASENRRRRSWVVLVPLGLYLAWLIAPELSRPPFSRDDGLAISNVLLIPNYLANTAAATAAVISGLSYNFTTPLAYEVNATWGFLVAAGMSAALVRRIRRGDLPLGLYSAGAVLLSLWTLAALVTHSTSEPDQNRYLYDGAVLVLLVAAMALEGIRITRTAVLGGLGATIVALATNIDMLRVGSESLRGTSAQVRAQMTAMTIAQGHESAGFVPQGVPTFTFIMRIIGGAGSFLAASERNGNPGYSVAQLRAQPDGVRQSADQALAQAEGLKFVPAGASVSARCLTAGQADRQIDIPVRPPGLAIRSATDTVATLHRFAIYPTVPLTALAGRLSVLRVPKDGAPDPWHLYVASGPVTVCGLAN
jgi:hypothetical protein